MENKSATKGTGYKKEGCSNKKATGYNKGPDTIRERLKEKGSGRNKGGANRKGA
jgi:hypothetical protein